ncbi:MAG TPA: hypothetical protein VMO20_08205 [Candidatus Acidoferrum sp.]|nr:hypothetical protein [Candidatus Acidoferrum sp.]
MNRSFNPATSSSRTFTRRPVVLPATKKSGDSAESRFSALTKNTGWHVSVEINAPAALPSM